MFSVKLISFLAVFWIAVGVLGIGVIGPIYAGSKLLKNKEPKVNRNPAVVKERVTTSVPMNTYGYRIDGSRVNEAQLFRNNMREAQNTLSEIRSFARIIEVMGK